MSHQTTRNDKEYATIMDPIKPEQLPFPDWPAVEVDEYPPQQFDPPLQQVEVQDDDDADE